MRAARWATLALLCGIWTGGVAFAQTNNTQSNQGSGTNGAKSNGSQSKDSFFGSSQATPVVYPPTGVPYPPGPPNQGYNIGIGCREGVPCELTYCKPHYCEPRCCQPNAFSLRDLLHDIKSELFHGVVDPCCVMNPHCGQYKPCCPHKSRGLFELLFPRRELSRRCHATCWNGGRGSGCLPSPCYGNGRGGNGLWNGYCTGGCDGGCGGGCGGGGGCTSCGLFSRPAPMVRPMPPQMAPPQPIQPQPQNDNFQNPPAPPITSKTGPSILRGRPVSNTDAGTPPQRQSQPVIRRRLPPQT